MAVLYGGSIVERGRIKNVLPNPIHPYTMGLRNASPALGDDPDGLVSVPGKPPDLETKPDRCVFEPRCPFATEECERTAPSLEKLPYRNQHVGCHRAERADLMRREAAEPETWGGGVEGSRPDARDVVLEVDDLHAWYERQRPWLRHVPTGGVPLSVSGLTRGLREWSDERGAGLRSVFDREESRVRAVDGVSLSVARGEILGVVGESGCGKSTLGQTLALVEEPTMGGFEFDGRPHEHYQDGDLQSFRQKLRIVFQNPDESLNPRMTVEHLVREPLSIHDYRSVERDAAVREPLAKVGLDPAERYLGKYPNELPAGQRQRVAIARALVIDPDFLICDEPASMLDISHDLASLSQIADRLAVMYLGRIAERGTTDRVVDALACAYAGLDTAPVANARAYAARKDGDRSASLVGGGSSSVGAAAFANGVAVRYLDWNDTYLSLELGHPSDNPGAVLAVADAYDCTGRETVLATALAYELQCRCATSRRSGRTGSTTSTTASSRPRWRRRS